MKSTVPYVVLNVMHGAISLNKPTIHNGFFKIICLHLLSYLIFNPGNSSIMFGKDFSVNLVRMR